MKAYLSDLWKKVKADAINAGALVSSAVGSVLSHIDDIAAQLGDPALTEQMKSTILTDAKWIGRWMTFVGILAIFARFKKLVQSPAPKA